MQACLQINVFNHSQFAYSSRWIQEPHAGGERLSSNVNEKKHFNSYVPGCAKSPRQCLKQVPTTQNDNTGLTILSHLAHWTKDYYKKEKLLEKRKKRSPRMELTLNMVSSLLFIFYVTQPEVTRCKVLHFADNIAPTNSWSQRKQQSTASTKYWKNLAQQVKNKTKRDQNKLNTLQQEKSIGTTFHKSRDRSQRKVSRSSLTEVSANSQRKVKPPRTSHCFPKDSSNLKWHNAQQQGPRAWTGTFQDCRKPITKHYAQS